MKNRQKSKGQVIVIFAVVMVTILLFVGLALDAGIVYISYGNLKRTVDSASLAAANEFKRSHDVNDMTGAASEVLNLMNQDYSNLVLLLCDMDEDGDRDDDLPPGFEERCPDTQNGEAPRKLVYVEAEMEARLSFLTLVGFHTVHLSSYSISEAAPLDIVIVLDTSESMASDTPGYSPNAPFDPTACNTTSDTALKCQPMLDAKNAAKALISTLADGYDQVAIITYDKIDHEIFTLSTDLTAASAAVDSIAVHDDPPVVFQIWSEWYTHPGSYNPLNSEDLDGDGLDADPNLGYTCPFAVDSDDDPEYLLDRWWSVAEGAPAASAAKFSGVGSTGVPCDRDDVYDSMDWDGNAAWSQNDADMATDSKWANGNPNYAFSGNSTCSGCGLRQGSDQLRSNGRFSSVWIMVFLSDGGVNLSDLHATSNAIPSTLVNGACGRNLLGSEPFWDTTCFDNDPTPRYCLDDPDDTCPPGTTHTTTSPDYSVLDYAFDMVDEAALTQSTNLDEPLGNEMAIYSIRLGSMSQGSPERFLRYMAAVGDDGDRTTDPCALTIANHSCGQYYFAPSGDNLLPIFEDIASRIYTRISQ